MKNWYVTIIAAAALCITLSVSASDSISTVKSAVAVKSASTPSADSAAPARLELTIEELARYNGRDGNPAYVAVNGVIYDVSGARAWKKGRHKGLHDAGADLTEDINKKSPHGPRILKKWPVVGKLVAAPAKK